MPILLAAGAWDNTCRIWQVNESNGTVEAKIMQNIGAPILSVDWFDVVYLKIFFFYKSFNLRMEVNSLLLVLINWFVFGI